LPNSKTDRAISRNRSTRRTKTPSMLARAAAVRRGIGGTPRARRRRYRQACLRIAPRSLPSRPRGNFVRSSQPGVEESKRPAASRRGQRRTSTGFSVNVFFGGGFAAAQTSLVAVGAFANCCLHVCFASSAKTPAHTDGFIMRIASKMCFLMLSAVGA